MNEHIGDIAERMVKAMASETVWDGKPITAPGVYANVPIETYHGDTKLFGGQWSISSTGIRQILRRPLEYWSTSPFNPNRYEKEPSEALEFGKAAHMLLLGEDGFAERYVLRPDEAPDGRAWNGNNNSCKEWLKAQADDGKVVITKETIAKIRRIAESLRRNDAVRLGILNGPTERSIFDQINGIWLRARPDVIPSNCDYVDLKTAASVDRDSISKAIYERGYHIQAGMVRKVVRGVLGPEAFESFTLVFVEKEPPHDVCVRRMFDTDIDLGERLVDLALKRMARCIKEGDWPGFDGYGEAFSYAEIPSWARTRTETDIAYMEAEQACTS